MSNKQKSDVDTKGSMPIKSGNVSMNLDRDTVRKLRCQKIRHITRDMFQNRGPRKPSDMRNDIRPEFKAILMEEETAKKGGGGGYGGFFPLLFRPIRGRQTCHGDCLNLIALYDAWAEGLTDKWNMDGISE